MAWRAVWQSLLVAMPLSLGLILQHIGLDLSSESTSAFLTSLTILFVPIITTVFLRQPPGGVMWIGVAIATGGVWLMTAATPSGFGLGEALGLGCALAFSWYILAVNAAKEQASRLVAGQFVITAIVCFALAALLPGRAILLPARLALVLADPSVWINLLLLTVITTVGGFALLTYFQPRLNPTQATLVYLCEPVFATVYAALAAGHRPTRIAIIGAAMILAANALVELLSSRSATSAEPIVLDWHSGTIVSVSQRIQPIIAGLLLVLASAPTLHAQMSVDDAEKRLRERLTTPPATTQPITSWIACTEENTKLRRRKLCASAGSRLAA